MWNLCYIHRNFAYFTSIPVGLQWGDDWDDAPYEHNAGEPYHDHRSIPKGAYVSHSILKVAFDGNLQEPKDGLLNSSYSVKQINEREVPWLRADENSAVWGGDSLNTFIEVVIKGGGNVYIPLGYKF